MMQGVHEGKAIYRLSQNPMENAFHDAWKEQQEGHTLEYLMGDGTRRAELTERDKLVAATVIQWLGSPVGENWLEGVLSNNNQREQK